MDSFANGLTLESEDFLLRPSRRDDYPYLKKLLNDHETMAALQSYFNVEYWTDSMIAARYDNYRAEQKMGHLIDFIVVDKSSDTIVGNCGFNSIDLKNFSGEFGIILDKRVWGKTASKMCHSLCLNYGFQELGLKSIKFITSQNNIRMRRFFEKINIPLLYNEDESTYVYRLNFVDWPTVSTKLDGQTST